jgi:hypothetical protein
MTDLMCHDADVTLVHRLTSRAKKKKQAQCCRSDMATVQPFPNTACTSSISEGTLTHPVHHAWMAYKLLLDQMGRSRLGHTISISVWAVHGELQHKRIVGQQGETLVQGAESAQSTTNSTAVHVAATAPQTADCCCKARGLQLLHAAVVPLPVAAAPHNQFQHTAHSGRMH